MHAPKTESSSQARSCITSDYVRACRKGMFLAGKTRTIGLYCSLALPYSMPSLKISSFLFLTILSCILSGSLSQKSAIVTDVERGSRGASSARRG